MSSFKVAPSAEPQTTLPYLPALHPKASKVQRVAVAVNSPGADEKANTAVGRRT